MFVPPVTYPSTVGIVSDGGLSPKKKNPKSLITEATTLSKVYKLDVSILH